MSSCGQLCNGAFYSSVQSESKPFHLKGELAGSRLQTCTTVQVVAKLTKLSNGTIESMDLTLATSPRQRIVQSLEPGHIAPCGGCGTNLNPAKGRPGMDSSTTAVAS